MYRPTPENVTTSPSSCKYLTCVALFRLQGDRSSIFTSEQAHKCGERWANLVERPHIHFIACYQTHLRQALASVCRTWLRTATSYQWSTDSTRLRRWLCTIFVYYSISRFCFFADYATLLLVCKCNYYRMKHKWFIGKCRFDQKLFTARRTHPGEKWSEPEMRSRDCRCWQH